MYSSKFNILNPKNRGTPTFKVSLEYIVCSMLLFIHIQLAGSYTWKLAIVVMSYESTITWSLDDIRTCGLHF